MELGKVNICSHKSKRQKRTEALVEECWTKLENGEISRSEFLANVKYNVTHLPEEGHAPEGVLHDHDYV